MKLKLDILFRRIYQTIRWVIGEENYLKYSMFIRLIMFHFRNIFSHEECYITCSGKRDGAGAQALAVMSTMLFADRMHIQYIHTPFSTLQHNYENDLVWEKKWEEFFNLGDDELKMNDDSLKISREISLGESPLKIKKQANTVFILRHCHEYTDMFPNLYSGIKNKLFGKYYGSSKGGYELNYEPKKVNIAIHIRRGDVNGNNQFRDKFTENKFVFDVMSKILEVIVAHGVEPSVCVYSEGNLADFKELEKLNPKFFLNISPFTTFHNLVCADVLVLSKSTFSYVAAILSRGIVFYESFRHSPLNNWIKVNENATFNTKLFSRKMSQFISEHQGFSQAL
jgi:hypothetical protein